jgi:hypothetical protein
MVEKGYPAGGEAVRASKTGANPGLRAWGPALVWMVGLGLWASPQPARSDSQPAPDHLTLLESLTTAAAQDIVTQLDFPPGTKVYLVAEANHPANWLVERALARWLTESGCGVVVQPGQAPSAPVPQGVAAAAPAPVRPAASGQAGAGATEPSAGAGDSLATASRDSTGGGGGQQAGAEGGETSEEPTSVAQQRRQERAQREAQQQAEAAAPQGGATGAVMSADLEPALPAEGEVLLYRVAELEVAYPWIKRSWVIGPRRYGRLATVRLRASHLTQPEHIISGVAQGDRIAIDEFPGWARSYLEGAKYPFPIPQPETKSLQRYIEPVFVVAIASGLIYLFYENQK